MFSKKSSVNQLEVPNFKEDSKYSYLSYKSMYRGFTIPACY